MAPKILGTIALAALVAAGCQSMTGKTAGQQVDDAGLTASVKTKLVADQLANLTRIDVDVEQGVVHLTGVVDSPEHKQRAEELAKEVRGVRQVQNHLAVQEAPDYSS